MSSSSRPRHAGAAQTASGRPPPGLRLLPALALLLGGSARAQDTEAQELAAPSASASAGAAHASAAPEVRATPVEAHDGSASGWRFEAGLLAGAISDATATFGERFGSTFALGGVQATGGFGLFELEGNFHALGTPVTDRARAAWGGALRVGVRTEHFAVRAGAILQLMGSGPAPAQWLPSLHAGWRAGRFGLSSGVFDGLGYMPAHLSAHWEGFSLGYVLPLGARAGAAFRVSPNLGLRVDAFAFAIGSYQTALLTVAAVFGEASSQENAAP